MEINKISSISYSVNLKNILNLKFKINHDIFYNC
jgi:hypothetical protein